MELPRKYPPEHYQRKAERYKHALRYLFGVIVDTTTQARWSDLISLGRSIDTYLDEGDRQQLPQRTQAIEAFLNNTQAVAVQFPALAPEALGLEKYAYLRDQAHRILQANLRIKQTTSLADYVRLRRYEGRLYAKQIVAVATPEVATQPGYARFHRLLLVTGEVTNLVNSFHGLPREYDQGELALKPDPLTRVRLLGHIAIALAESCQQQEDTRADHC